MGAYSVGVPLGGRATLEQEKVVYKEVQTQTIPTSGYESRIPVLGHNRIAALIAPGGRGTLREIATWLVQEAPKENPGLLIFISRNYYEPLVKWLIELPLPERMRSRIHVVNNEEELFSVVREHQLASEEKIAQVKEAIAALNRVVVQEPPPKTYTYERPPGRSFGVRQPEASKPESSVSADSAIAAKAPNPAPSEAGAKDE
jgi:hypothetical protein